jgi:hypothetical protein
MPLPEPRKWTVNSQVGRCWVALTRRPDVPRSFGVTRDEGWIGFDLGHTYLTFGWNA